MDQLEIKNRIFDPPITDAERARFNAYFERESKTRKAVRDKYVGNPKLIEDAAKRWVFAERAIRLGATDDRSLDHLVDTAADDGYLSRRSAEGVRSTIEKAGDNPVVGKEKYGFDRDEPVLTPEQVDAKKAIETPGKLDSLIQSRIDEISKGSYQEDPALDAALAAVEGVRTNQIKAVEDLSQITLGERTLSDMRGANQRSDLAAQAAGGAQAGFGGYANAMRESTDQSGVAAVQERSGQRSAIAEAANRFVDQDTRQLQSANQRSRNILGHGLRNQELVNKYLGLATTENIRRMNEAGQIYGMGSQEQSALAGMGAGQQPNYGMNIATGVLNAGGVLAKAAAEAPQLRKLTDAPQRRSVASMLSEINAPTNQQTQRTSSAVGDFLRGRANYGV